MKLLGGTKLIPNITKTADYAKTLVTIAGKPLVVVAPYGRGRIVQWTTYEWLDANILGFFNGLDDVVWRSIVWAARKPFVFQGNIPLVSMRIDDCYGPWDDFAYVEIINKYGIIPHIAFFMDPMSPSAAKKLGQYTRAGKAEAFIHSRGKGNGNFMFYDVRIEDFHNSDWGRPFPEDKLRKDFEDLDRFHKTYGIQYARTVIGYWVSVGKNVLPYLRKMGVEFMPSPATLPYHGPTAVSVSF